MWNKLESSDFDQFSDLRRPRKLAFVCQPANRVDLISDLLHINVKRVPVLLVYCWGMLVDVSLRRAKEDPLFSLCPKKIVVFGFNGAQSATTIANSETL